MNKTRLMGPALEKALADRLRELLGGVEWLRDCQVEHQGRAPDAGFDLLAMVPLPTGGVAALCVECKRELRPSAFRMVADKEFSPPGRPKAMVPVLALPFVSPRLAELCREYGWSWFDLAGNCWIDVPGILHLERSGHKRVHTSPRPVANLSTPEAGRVIRALLAPDNVATRWTQRHMATHFGQLPRPIPKPSLGLVNKVVRHLRDEAFIEDAPGGGLQVRDPVKLLAAWSEAYRFDRHARRDYFTLKQGPALREALAGLALTPGGRAAYAAFSAAELQAPHVRQPKVWLYLSASLEDEFCQHVEAKLVDSGENVVVLTPDDDGVFYLCDSETVGGDRLCATNPVQTYVDLCHCGGRGEEAAEALLEQILKRAWATHGHDP